MRFRIPRLVRAFGALGIALVAEGLSRIMVRLARREATRCAKRRAEGLGILFGIHAIARFLGVTRKQAHVLVRGRLIPTFDLAGVTCARAPTLREHIAELERRGSRRL